MNNNIENLLKNENKVRNNWFNAFFLFYTMPFVYSIVTTLFENGYLKTFTSPSYLFSFLWAFACTIPLNPFFWINYHCAYKKKGFVWLDIQLVLIVIGYLITIFSFRKDFTDDLQGVCLLALRTVPTAVFWYSCYKLRDTNRALLSSRKMKREEVIIDAECEVLDA